MARNEKSRDFCLTFMNSMEDGRRNPGSRPWTFKTRENPGSRPSTFADCEFQLCILRLYLEDFFPEIMQMEWISSYLEQTD
jgi:hypothetical protein